MIAIIIVLIVILLFLYSTLQISSECSRIEEMETKEWQQQEYGK